MSDMDHNDQESDVTSDEHILASEIISSDTQNRAEKKPIPTRRAHSYRSYLQTQDIHPHAVSGPMLAERKFVEHHDSENEFTCDVRTLLSTKNQVGCLTE